MKKIKIFLATFMSFAMVISALSGLYFKDAKTSKAASKTHLLKDEDTSIITNTVDNEHIVDSYYFFQNYRHIYPKVGGFIYDYDNKITLGFDSNKVINNLYKTDNWVWYDVTDGQATVIDIDKEVDGSRPKFEEGHNYTLKMDYYALDGYEFKYTDGKLDISMEFIDNAFGINNPPTMVATATEGFDPRKAISINVNFGTITNKISEIEIIATDFGKGDDINEIYMTWYNYDSMKAVDSSIISFVKNGEVINRDYKAKEPEYLTPGNYSIMITMVANEGRVFEPDIKLKMHLAVPDEETGEMKLVEYEYFDTAYVNSDGSAALFKYDFEITCDHNCSEEWSTDFNSHWHECPDCHEKCDLEEHTFDEGETVDGVTTYTCSVCGYKKTLKNTDGKFMYAENSDGIELTSYVSPTEETDITIPETINDKPVTSIGEYCFASNKYKTSIESIKLPDSINTIGNGAFNGLSSLTSVNIPDGVERIEAETFFGCEALTSIDVPLSVTFIGESAFAYTSIEEIKLPCNVSIIKNNAFRECTKLKEIYIPDSVVELGNAAFLGCSGLTKVTMGSGITSLPQSLFDGCNSITDFTFPVLIQSMARYALPSTIKNVYFYGTEDEFETLIDS
ncbi:MAG: leucine-rich repeat protein, partial [Lachnospiraceae bacterium]|nr:leucine-rich repeat protein [Lachnospiraceae bacterium]